MAAVEHAKALGIETVVTDHHLPGDEILTPSSSTRISAVTPSRANLSRCGRHLLRVDRRALGTPRQRSLSERKTAESPASH
ncbi:MAG: hypothetical protein ACLRRK_00435 [Parasutterella sp.]